MPYIKKTDREKFESHIQVLVDYETYENVEQEDKIEYAISELYLSIETVGELNYVLSSILWRRFDKKPSYTVANKIIDVFEELKLRLTGVSVYYTDLGNILYPIIDQLREYKNMEEVLGVIECTKLEFYRRKVSVYEDLKINDPNNGDIE
jgi:hypothetical protein